MINMFYHEFTIEVNEMDVTITKFYSFIKKMCFFVSDITFLFWFYVLYKSVSGYGILYMDK